MKSDSYSRSSVGARIEELAARVGGKRELANLSGVHETQLYKYINGDNAPSVAVAAALALAGSESLDWLLLGKRTGLNVDELSQADVHADAHPTPASGIGCFKAKLKKLTAGKSLRRFASECGLSEATLRSYLSGDTYPTLDRLELIAKAGNISPVELAFGLVLPPCSDEDEYVRVPLYDAHCSAGSGAWNERSRVLVKLSFTRYSLHKKGLASADLACLRVAGDSMTGLLEDGDTVMIDLNRNTLEGEGVYVVMLDDHLYAKRLQRQFDGSVMIISQNKEYPPMLVPKDRLPELRIIGMAVWAEGWFI